MVTFTLLRFGNPTSEAVSPGVQKTRRWFSLPVYLSVKVSAISAGLVHLASFTTHSYTRWSNVDRVSVRTFSRATCRFSNIHDSRHCEKTGFISFRRFSWFRLVPL